LFSRKNEIEKDIGMALDWRELPDKKASRILIKTKGSIENNDEYEAYFKWLIDTGIKFKNIFSEYIKNFG